MASSAVPLPRSAAQPDQAFLRDDITGALICRSDIYLQWLEGLEKQVRDALAGIERDDRHLEVRLHVAESVSERMFGDWAILHDPAADRDHRPTGDE
jgi:hypothetical protein